MSDPTVTPVAPAPVSAGTKSALMKYGAGGILMASVFALVLLNKGVSADTYLTLVTGALAGLGVGGASHIFTPKS